MKNRARLILGALALLAAVGCSPRIYEVKLDRSLFLDAQPGQTVYLSVKNTSSLQTFPLADDLRAALERKGYTIVDRAEDADVDLRANIRYSGLIEEGMKAGKIVGGAAAGGVVGGLGGAALGASRRGSAATALGGILIGAGLGAWLEHRDLKNTFITIVDFQVTERSAGKPPREATIFARIREEDLTMESAASRVRPDIAAQIAGLF